MSDCGTGGVPRKTHADPGSFTWHARGTAAAKVGFGFLPQDRRSSCEGAAVAADVLQFLAGSEPCAMAGAGMASPSPMAARSSAILPATLERTFGNRNSESTATTHSTAVAT